jgi:hypothetical protein
MYYVLSQLKDGRWCWTAYSNRHRVLANSPQTFDRLAECQEAIERSTGGRTPIFEWADETREDGSDRLDISPPPRGA